MADVRLLILGSLCHNGKIDSEKLAALAGVKKTSAQANYWRAKNNLLALMEKNESATQAANFKPEDSNTAPKARASTKRRATKDAPAKPDSPPKHRKTAAMAAPEPEPALAYTQEAERISCVYQGRRLSRVRSIENIDDEISANNLAE
ncbi:hypothetical protein N7519_005825 [Penicillium mononematosum]|uniref:uncharacterized protein n=1 Tax=Penicillium mononematosum TaxID=268346 RepID=UPI002548C2C2|nr:uncharacterized protein N7519_005825 [Penicillium mononematosum]KAJ6184524.1 hypothetical protein N7519_005825 [Penicillium mononematosum]